MAAPLLPNILADVFRVSNTAITHLIRFLKYFVRSLGRVFDNAQLETFSSNMPIIYNSMLLQAGVSSGDFIEYVVCPSCHSVYNFEDCIVYVGREKRPRSCSHITYPNHPHVSRRQPCGASLLKIVRTGKGSKLVPLKVLPLSKSLEILVKRPAFLTACEEWRDRAHFIPSSHLGDI